MEINLDSIPTGVLILAYKDGFLEEDNKIGMRITNLENFNNKFCEMFGLVRCGLDSTYEYKNYYDKIREHLAEGYNVAYAEIEIISNNDIDKEIESLLDSGKGTILLGIEY